MADTAAQRIAKEMMSRFPIKAPVVSDKSVAGDTPYQVGIPEFKISLNKTAPDDQIGRYDALIHVTTKVATSGFNGGSYSKYMDDKGNVVFAMMGDRYGVSGTAIPGPDDVTKPESKILPLAILTAVYSVEVIPVRVEDDELDNLRRLVEQLSQGAKIVRDGLKDIGATVADIAAAIKAMK